MGQQEMSLDRLGVILAETARSWRQRLDQRLRPLGLSQAKWLVLLHLAKAGRELTQRDLAERLGVEGPTLVRLLDRMAADGWIERRDSTSDRRCKTVHPTAQARAATRDIERIAHGLREEIYAEIPDADLHKCLEVLLRIRDRIGQL